MTHTQTQGADGAGTKTAGFVCVAPDGVPFWPSTKTTEAESRKACFGPCDEWRLSDLKREGWRCEPITLGASPAPAATPGVPDSLREAFAAATDSPVFVHDFADPAVSSAPGCQDVSLSFVTPDHITAAFMGNGLAGTIDQARKDAVALAAAWNHVRALIAAQPAGQAGDAGAARTVEFMCEGQVCTAEVPTPSSDPNSSRSGAEETEDAVASAIEGRWTDLIGPAMEGGNIGWKRRDLCREFAKAALAARPEAPSDAGWSREDLEAFVAREWPEGRSAGAAARELVRALGVRGLAPTLQRLLTDLLGQINFASTDRAQILADFANAAPEAARMAKIDSFERWNPRVFDPTPPSDPAPSGQAEG